VRKFVMCRICGLEGNCSLQSIGKNPSIINSSLSSTKKSKRVIFPTILSRFRQIGGGGRG
jgi:hypothetical protein